MSINAYNRQCLRNVPGNIYLFLTEVSNIESVEITDGEVSNIIMTGTFKQIQSDRDSLRRTETKVSGKVWVYDHDVIWMVKRPSIEVNELTESLADASPCGMAAIVYDNNGKSWLIGWSEEEDGERALSLKDYAFVSGKAATDNDAQAIIYNLNSRTKYLDLPMNDTINQYIHDSIMAGEDVGFTP